MVGQILRINDVVLPLEEAVQKSAEQNARCDQRNFSRVTPFESLPEEARARYLKEARDLLQTFGSNRLPLWPETDHYYSKKEPT